MFSRIIDQYRGSTAVVVGAGGIGSEIVRLLEPSVARLVVADYNDSLLAQLREKHGAGRLLTRKLDVSDSAAVVEFASFLSTTVGAPQFFFYTVGILTVEPFISTTFQDWERAVAVNLHGAFYCTKAVAELMIPKRSGSILLLGSIAGTKARSGSRVNPVYNVTKAGLAAFVNATAMQLRSQGVRINCISPGPTATSMMDVQPPQVHASVREITLDGRMNHPTEVAELALFVAAHGRFTGEDVAMGGGAGLGG
jgi:NAD(P)-dependent dehydrogenase (short-subunit alcohol dehydrogenase family)